MAAPAERPPLSKDDANWTGIKLWLATRIRSAQKQLEQEGMTAQQYDVQRGRIIAFREFIRAVEPERAPEKTDAQGRDYFGAGADLDYEV